MSFPEELARQLHIDLAHLHRQVEAFADEADLWKTIPGVTNPVGNLVLHLEGNLREYIGRQLGGIDYQRNRPIEFSTKGNSRADLCARVSGLGKEIPVVVRGLTEETLSRQYSQIVLAGPLSTREFLMHLHAHLSWHLGQIDYLRRILTDGGPLPAVYSESDF